MTEVKDSDETIAQLSRPSNDANALKVRLETHDEIERFEMYLRGEKLEYHVVNNQLMPVLVKFGKPKANPNGLQSIMMWFSGIFNKHCIMGNFPMDKKGFSTGFDNYIYWFRKDFGDYIMLNLYDFGIDIREYNGLIDEAVTVVSLVISRAIGNEERKGLSHFVKSETSMLRNENKLPFFKR